MARQLRIAADENLAEAQYYYGLLLQYGKGVPRNEGASLPYLQKAAENGHAHAQYRLGAMYRSGWHVPKDEAAANEWLSRAESQSAA